MEKNWTLEKYVYEAKPAVDDMVNAIDVFETLKEKYPNDEYIDGAIEILRQEICLMFGGSIYND